ncbi:MAG: hypothetical protein WCS37_08090, partial [Chloroflexota bacterium]
MEQLLASQTKLEATLHRHQQELRLFEQIRQALFANSDMNNVFPVVVERIATAFSFPLVSIYLLEYGELRLQAQVGRQEYYGIIPLNQGVCGRVARTAQAVFILDVAADADYLEDLPGVT